MNWKLAALARVQLVGRVSAVTAKRDAFVALDVRMLTYDDGAAVSEVYVSPALTDLTGLSKGDRVVVVLDPVSTLRRKATGKWEAVPCAELRPADPADRGVAIGDAAQVFETLVEVDSFTAEIIEARERLESDRVKSEQSLEQRHVEFLASLEAREAAVARALDDLRARGETLDTQELELLVASEELEAREAEFSARGGERFLALVSRERPASTDIETDFGAVPGDLVAGLKDAARDAGLELETVVMRRATLAVLLGAIERRIVVFGGKPGSGKSTLAQWLPGALGFWTSAPIAVRPGWLDAGEFLGYFDPRGDRFIAGPFTSAVSRSEREAVGRARSLTLDEMNLARIENYGADLLALYERSVGPEADASLELVPELIIEEAERRIAEEAARDDGGARLESAEFRRDVAVARITNRLPIGDDLLIVGTVNDDATTHGLSPKVFDRSFALHVPPPARAAPLSVEGVPPVARVTPGRIRAWRASARLDDDPYITALENVIEDASGGQRVLSARTRAALARGGQIAGELGIAKGDVIDDVAVMRVLAPIKARRSDAHAVAELERLAEAASEAGFHGMAAECERMLASGAAEIQYLS